MAGTVTDALGLDAPSDAELIAAVRGGDNAAYGTLFDRHRDAADRLARQLVRGPDADDLVAESFTRVLVTLQQGKGPDESFRAYLLTAMRRFHIDRLRAGARVRPTDDEAALDRSVEWVDPAEMRFEAGAAAQAFAALPERWQTVLWHLDVEGQKPADLAPILGMSANSVSALAYRAREGLRQAYLQQHLSAEQREACRATTEKLGAYVRDGLAARDTAKVEGHLDECARCMGLYLELREINHGLAAWLAPALLGSAATGYLTAGTTSGLGGLALIKGAVAAVTAPIRSLGPVGGSAAAGVTAVAVVAGIAMASNGADQPAAADPTTQVTTTTAATPPPATSKATPKPKTPKPTPPPTTSPTTPPTTPQPGAKTEHTPEPTTSPAPQPSSSPTPTTQPEPAAPTATLTMTPAGLLSQDLTISVSDYPDPVVVTVEYPSVLTLILQTSGGWDCTFQGTKVRCTGLPTNNPLVLTTFALVPLQEPSVSVEPAAG